jgi:hypothetical protein
MVRATLTSGARAMPTRLHLVFGGELKDPQGTEFVDPSNLEVVGIYPNYATAQEAWRAAAQRTVDNAQMRFFIAHLPRLRDEELETSRTEEMG